MAAVTGELSDERVLRIGELEQEAQAGLTPVLVAPIACLRDRPATALMRWSITTSAGTRHEQREGGSTASARKPAVRALMLHGGDSNPVDERRSVILSKNAIRKELGVSADPWQRQLNHPSGAQRLVRRRRSEQPTAQLGAGLSSQSNAQLNLDEALEASVRQGTRQTNRTIFAQRSLKPEEVMPEWERSRDVLGNEASVERLVREACTRLKLPFGPAPAGQGCWQLDLNAVEANRQGLLDRLSQHDLSGKLNLCFKRPAKGGATSAPSPPAGGGAGGLCGRTGSEDLEPDLRLVPRWCAATPSPAKRWCCCCGCATTIKTAGSKAVMNLCRIAGGGVHQRQVNGDQLELLEGDDALALLQVPPAATSMPANGPIAATALAI